MSDAEALMWNVEKDPWLNPNGGVVTVVDQPIDFDSFRIRMKHAVAEVPRLRERVVAGFGRVSPPSWVTDDEFDFDYHVRHIMLPSPGSLRQLYDLSTRLYEDPYDRTRPLWMFVVIDGLEGGKGALFWKSHHSVTDGYGMVRLAERYMETERDAEVPPDIDLGEVVADAITSADSSHDRRGTIQSAARSAGHVRRRQAGRLQRAAGEMAIWAAEPQRAIEVIEASAGAARSAYRQLRVGSDHIDGSSLWGNRSRRRHLESLSVPLEAAKSAGKALGGTINDVFVTGAVAAASAYHAKRGVDVESFNVSFVVSTRTDGSSAGNSFTPTQVRLPGTSLAPAERFEIVRDRMAEARADVVGSGTLGAMAGLANLMPTSMVTQMARAQAAKVDFATSNLRAAPFAVYISGAKALESTTMGPVAGTAFNLTTLSYNGSLDMGVFIDPAAVEDPSDLRDCLAQAYNELIEAGKA